jgi:hypothetical protein
MNFPDKKTTVAVIIKMAGIPKAIGKQSSIPKHFTSSRRIGVTELEDRLSWINKVKEIASF